MPLDTNKYKEAVDFWVEHVAIKKNLATVLIKV